MISARLFYRFGLGPFDEACIAEASGEAVALLHRRGERLGQPFAFGGNVDHAFERDGDRLALDDELRRGSGRRGIEADRLEAREAIELRCEPVGAGLERGWEMPGQPRP